jgi:hypothetical protein
MKRQGIALYNRGTQGMNSVVSGKLAKAQKGSLKYPHGNYPMEKYVIISVYEGNLAESIGALTSNVSKIHDKLGEKLGEVGGAVSNAVTANSGKVKDTATKVKQDLKNAYDKGSNKIKSAVDAFDEPAPTGGLTSSGAQSTGSITNVATQVGGAIMDLGPMIGGAVAETGKAGFSDVINAVSKNGLGNGSVSDHAKSFVANIYLPLPNEIQEALSHSYEEEAGWVGDVKAKTPFLDSGVNMAVGAAAFISKMTGSRSVTFDKNRVSMYTESAFRTISLSWALVPNNQEESKAIHAIVKALKKYSSPESVSGKILLKSPHFFRLKFGNELIDEALQFYEVVIEEIGIDYSPGGNMEMNHDDTPKTLSLNITFKDREPKLMEDWDKGVPKATEPSKPSCSAGGASNSGQSSTQTDPTAKPGKQSGAGGGSDAKANSGQEQAKKPENKIVEWGSAEHERLTKEQLNAGYAEGDEVRDIYDDSTANPLMGLTRAPIDLTEKLPAETNTNQNIRYGGHGADRNFKGN